MNEAHAGVGSVSFTTCTMLQSMMGTKTARVAYRGTAPSLNDLVAGQVDFGCDQIVNVVSQIQAGTIKAYAIATPERSEVLKDVPTTKEAGLPEFRVSAWNAIFAPRNTPAEAVAKLNGALVAARAGSRCGRCCTPWCGHGDRWLPCSPRRSTGPRQTARSAAAGPPPCRDR